MHDKFGHALKEGDEVLVHATVTQCHAGEEYCNLTVKAVEPMFPGDDHTTIVLNAKQVMKAKKVHGDYPVPLDVPIPGQTPQPPEPPPEGGGC